MNSSNNATETVAPGSVETPGSETTPQATTATREAPASPSPAQPVSREDRRRSIASWLDQPSATPSTAKDKPATTDTGKGSPPEGASGANEDLSQTTPAEAEDTSVDTGLGDEDEDKDAETPESETPESPKGQWPKQAVERVRKLKDQKQQLKNRLAESDSKVSQLEAQLQELRSAKETPAITTKPPQDDALKGISDPKVIQQKAEEANRVMTWAEDLWEVAADDPEQVGGQLEAEGVKAPEGGWTVEALRQTLCSIRTNARSVAQAAPKRLEFVQLEDRSLATAMSLAPDLENPDSDLAKRVTAAVAARPRIKEDPDWPILVTAAVIGIQVLQERQKASKGTSSPAGATPLVRQVPKAPKLPGAPRSSVAVAQASEVDVVRERALRPGASREDRRNLVRAMLDKSPAPQA